MSWERTGKEEIINPSAGGVVQTQGMCLHAQPILSKIYIPTNSNPLDVLPFISQYFLSIYLMWFHLSIVMSSKIAIVFSITNLKLFLGDKCHYWMYIELQMVSEGSEAPVSHSRQASLKLISPFFAQLHLFTEAETPGVLGPPLKSVIKEHPKTLRCEHNSVIWSHYSGMVNHRVSHHHH